MNTKSLRSVLNLWSGSFALALLFFFSACSDKPSSIGRPCNTDEDCGGSGLICGQANECVVDEKTDGGGSSEKEDGGTDAGDDAGEDAGPSCHWVQDRVAFCAEKEAECGLVPNGCGGTVDCGACARPMTCGGGGVSGKCGGDKACEPKTCADLGLECGQAGDGCGDILDCGTCISTERCGGGGVLGVCGGNYAPFDPNDPDTNTPVCTEKSCADQGFNCGSAGNGCGSQIASCGTCPAIDPSDPENEWICGGGGQPNVCGGWKEQGLNPYCTNLCLNQEKAGECASGVTTTIKGIVTTDARWGNRDPIYNAFVYIPNKDLQLFVDGVTCDQCASATGAPLVETKTNYMGEFVLEKVPTGVDFPIVVQLGKWRRHIMLSKLSEANGLGIGTNGITKCTTKDVGEIRLPRVQGGNPTASSQWGGDSPFNSIPRIAISTGDADGIQCLLRKMGIDDSEFTDGNGVHYSGTTPPSGGRVHLYKDNGMAAHNRSGVTLPTAANLYENLNTLKKYDMVIFACVGSPNTKTTSQIQNVVNYANVGGRVFAGHYSRAWFIRDSNNNPTPWFHTANWRTDALSGTGYGIVNQTGANRPPDPKGKDFADWALHVGAGSSQGTDVRISVNNEIRLENCGLNSPNYSNTQDWIPYGTTPSICSTPPSMHLTFNTPASSSTTTVPSQDQCGRALFSGFHASGGSGASGTFPGACPAAELNPQEKVLEFMLFDLSSCVEPDGPTPPRCEPFTCADMGANCGTVGDGCGSTINCGECLEGQVCGGAGPNKCGGCVPLTAQAACGALGFECGFVSNGCGGLHNCGDCGFETGLTCGGGGVPGKCGEPDCIRLTCEAQGIECGQASNGCGGTIACGDCPPNQTCGGRDPGKCSGMFN